MYMNLKPKVPKEQLMAGFREAAPVFAKLDGLVWKIWLENEEEGILGGVYYFKDQASLDKYQASDMYKSGFEHPAFDVVTVKTFDIIEEFSKVTRAPI